MRLSWVVDTGDSDSCLPNAADTKQRAAAGPNRSNSRLDWIARPEGRATPATLTNLERLRTRTGKYKMWSETIDVLGLLPNSFLGWRVQPTGISLDQLRRNSDMARLNCRVRDSLQNEFHHLFAQVLRKLANRT
jgi:hypothetical protein